MGGFTLLNLLLLVKAVVLPLKDASVSFGGLVKAQIDLFPWFPECHYNRDICIQQPSQELLSGLCLSSTPLSFDYSKSSGWGLTLLPSQLCCQVQQTSPNETASISSINKPQAENGIFSTSTVYQMFGGSQITHGCKQHWNVKTCTTPSATQTRTELFDTGEVGRMEERHYS